MYILLAFLTGFSIVLATVLNGKLAERIGIINGAIINYIMGLVTSLIVWLVLKDSLTTLDILRNIPLYYFIGGIIGVLVIFLFNMTVPKIPAVYIVILPFIGQILTSALIDYFYLDIFSKGKVIGGVLFLIGLQYNAQVDKKYREETLTEQEEAVAL